MTEDEISQFEKTQTQLESLHSEVTALSKKSQNDALNKFKLKLVNKTLKEANSLLSGKYMPFDYFEQFSEDDMPTNSDVAMIIGQYLSCMEKLRADNIKNDKGWWYWLSNDAVTNIRTSAPRKIQSK